jgi:DNA-binding transcriptional ArsR family regulator
MVRAATASRDRSAARRPTPAPAGKARVRDFSRPGAGLAVEFDTRTVYDFVFSLSEEAGTTDDLPAADREWLAGAKSGLDSTVRAALADYGSEFFVMLAGLAVDRPEVRTAADLVTLVGTLDTQTVRRALIADDLRDADRRALAEGVIAGDSAAIDEMIASLADHIDADRCDRFRRLLRDPAALISVALVVLAAWLEPFRTIEDRILGMLHRDVELRATDRATLGAVELIERTTGGVRFLAEPGLERVVLAPSYFARPYNFLLAGEDWRFFGYPLGDDALDSGDPDAPPQAVVRLHRALGDETRLRILRLLADRDWYLTEIAQQLELSKPTIKHHLALLRSAGLATVTAEGGLTYYTLRRQAIDDGGGALRTFLHLG